MLSRSLLRFQQQPSPSDIPDPSMGRPATRTPDTTGNSGRTGGLFRNLDNSIGRIIKYSQKKPLRFTAWCIAFVAAIFWYEANITHGGRVRSWSFSGSEYQMDDSAEGQKVRRIKAEKVLSPAERSVLEKMQNDQTLHSMRQQSSSSEPKQKKSDNSSSDKKKLPGRDDGFETKSSTLFVSQGHLHEKEDNWNVRNHERNWSILAQDHFKQKDSFMYRMERSRDDDFGRHSTKVRQLEEK